MNFKEAYKDAAEHIVQPNIDARSVLDEARRRKARKRQVIQKGATLASIILVLGVGGISTARAAGYLGSIIRVDEDGFVSGDVYTMADTYPEAETGEITDTYPEAATGQLADCEEAVYAAQNDSVMPVEEEPACMVIEDIVEQSFDSVERFMEECPEIIIALPHVEISEAGFEEVHVVGESVFVRYQFDENKSLDIQRYDYSESLGHSASIVFPGEICNERIYTDARGFNYTLIDEERLSEEKPMRIHGAVSVECYEIYLNFYGFEEAEVFAVLESMDLSVYCE